MTKISNSKQYDLENRTLGFAKKVRSFVKLLPKTIGNLEDSKQLVRASGSVGANYIEANESLSKKDFIMRASFKTLRTYRLKEGPGTAFYHEHGGECP